MLDVRALTIFARVAERRSFVRAARELGITQSGVSNAVGRLEAQLGVRLLARTTRSVGRLRIDMPVCFGRLKVVPVLGAFRARYPHVRLIVSLTDRYVDLVEEGIDLAIRLGPLQDSSLVARRLTQSQFRLVSSPEYFKTHGKPHSLEDLTRHNCLGFTLWETRRVRPWRFRRADTDVSITPTGDMSFSDAGAITAATVAGYGIAQMRDYYADPAIAAGELKPVLEKHRPEPDPIWLIYPQTRHLSPKVRVFIDHMTAQFLSPSRTRGHPASPAHRRHHPA